MANRDYRSRQRRSTKSDTRYDSPAEYSSSSYEARNQYTDAPPPPPPPMYSPAPHSPGRTDSSASASPPPDQIHPHMSQWAADRAYAAHHDLADDKHLLHPAVTKYHPPNPRSPTHDLQDAAMATQSESEPPANDGGETEDESEEHSAQSDGRMPKSADDIKASFDPNIIAASELLQSSGVDASIFGYARLTGAGKGALDYLVRKTSIIIGRAGYGADCQVRSEARHISRQHARLFWVSEEDQWAISCLSRKNGLLVDGTPVVPGAPPMPLQSRNLIEVGDVAFFFLTATGTVFRFHDLSHVEEEIVRLRESQENLVEEEPSTYEGDPYASFRRDSINGRAKLEERLQAIRKAKSAKYAQRHHSIGRSERSTSPHRQSPDYAEATRTTLPKTGHKKGKYGRKKKTERAAVAGTSDNWNPWQNPNGMEDTHRNVRQDETEGESEEEGQRSQKNVHQTSGKRKQVPDKPVSQGKKKKERPFLKRDEEFKSKYPSSYFRDEWNKKERTDFGRALFAIGVDAIRDDRGDVLTYDWSRFRKIAELPKKNDEMLEEYYKRVMSDVHSLLDEEEREKQSKGPRTKHKQGCDCVVCENTRKSRRKKREGRDESETQGIDKEAEAREDRQVKSTAKSNDRLVGLVTAQKLRVRLSIHEAARQIDSDAGIAVMNKLRAQVESPPELPAWWRNGYHDRDLMIGTEKHGVGQWSDIWQDESLQEFANERIDDENLEWPTPQGAMKRLREVSSAINAEMRRLEKKASKRAPEKPKKAMKMKKPPKKPSAKRGSSSRDISVPRGKKPGRQRTEESADEYEDDAAHAGYANSRRMEDAGETTAESGSEGQEAAPISGAMIETEDEEEVQLEVEEEMEIEEEEDEAVMGSGHTAGPSVAAADVSTDDEGEEEVIQYETASDSASE